MNELEFVTSIDARFPYTDLERGLELATTALDFSPFAIFAVVEELARPPYGAEAPVSDRLEILGIIRKEFNHPLANIILDLSERMIKDEVVTVSEILAMMEVIEAYPGEYGPLNIAYFSCDDKDGVVDSVYKRIVAKWQESESKQ